MPQGTACPLPACLHAFHGMLPLRVCCLLCFLFHLPAPCLELTPARACHTWSPSDPLWLAPALVPRPLSCRVPDPAAAARIQAFMQLNKTAAVALMTPAQQTAMAGVSERAWKAMSLWLIELLPTWGQLVYKGFVHAGQPRPGWGGVVVTRTARDLLYGELRDAHGGGEEGVGCVGRPAGDALRGASPLVPSKHLGSWLGIMWMAGRQLHSFL